MNYSDYFEIKHCADEVSMDEFISEAVRTDIKMNMNQELLIILIHHGLL